MKEIILAFLIYDAAKFITRCIIKTIVNQIPGGKEHLEKELVKGTRFEKYIN
jgi:hypothetical protein